MIQRVQTIYLLLATIFMGLAVFMPLATFYGEGHQITLTSFEVLDTTHPDTEIFVFNTIYLGVLLSVAALLPLVNIFLYKRRYLQLRLCFAEIVLLIGSLGFIAYYIYHLANSFESVQWKFELPSIFPFIALVFVIMALRAIVRDDRLVKSLNRIR